MTVDLQTVDFNSLTRDKLRELAREHGVRGISKWSSTTTFHVSQSNKEELVKGLEQARKEGKFGSETLTGNVTVKNLQRIVFLKGEGCHNQSTHIAGIVEGDKLTIYSEFEPDDVAPELNEYERFATSINDLRAFLDALEA